MNIKKFPKLLSQMLKGTSYLYLGKEIKWKPWKEEIRKIFHNSEHSIDNPVNEPLCVIVLGNALDSFNPTNIKQLYIGKSVHINLVDICGVSCDSKWNCPTKFKNFQSNFVLVGPLSGQFWVLFQALIHFPARHYDIFACHLHTKCVLDR
jgi:hypothetical protein